MAALTFSRRKMLAKVRVTEVVPAPDEPVMAMMGCRSDMAFVPLHPSGTEQTAGGKERRAALGFMNRTVRVSVREHAARADVFGKQEAQVVFRQLAVTVGKQPAGLAKPCAVQCIAHAAGIGKVRL